MLFTKISFVFGKYNRVVGNCYHYFLCSCIRSNLIYSLAFLDNIAIHTRHSLFLQKKFLIRYSTKHVESLYF